MPIINAHIPEGYTTNQKKALLQNAKAAVMETLAAPPENVRIVLNEYKAGNALIAGDEHRPFVMLVAYLITGRDVETKAAFIKALSDVASAALQVSDVDIRVLVQDMPKEDMGLAGGISALAAGR